MALRLIISGSMAIREDGASPVDDIDDLGVVLIPQGERPAGVADSMERVNGAVVDGSSIELLFDSGEGAGNQVSVAEEPGLVTVQVASYREPPAGTPPGVEAGWNHMAVRAVIKFELSEPLGDRQIIDRTTGQPIPRFPASRLALDSGWTHMRRSIGNPDTGHVLTTSWRNGDDRLQYIQNEF